MTGSPDTIFSICAFLYFTFQRLSTSIQVRSRLSGLKASFNQLHNVPPHRRGGKKKATTTKMSGCFSLRALLPFQLLKDMCSDSFCGAVQSGPSVIPRSSSCCPDLCSALNKTSRCAVRDQLTLKLLDFALKASAPQMSTELCRQFFFFFFLPLCVQTLPEGT